jgi:hypothetical protein
MATNIESKRRLRAIRRLSGGFPDRTAEERLAKIAGIATGDLDPADFRHQTSPDLLDRLKAGQASRAPRNAADKRPVAEVKAEEREADEKKRKKRGGHDRKEDGGQDRVLKSTDVNL